jgi:hypothetical protein
MNTTKEIIMFATIAKSTLHASVIALIVFSANAAKAHPEMDAWGRDISSGPLPAMTGPSAKTTTGTEVYDLKLGETTASIVPLDDCAIGQPKICPVSATQPKPMRVRPDY